MRVTDNQLRNWVDTLNQCFRRPEGERLVLDFAYGGVMLQREKDGGVMDETDRLTRREMLLYLEGMSRGGEFQEEVAG